MCRIVGPLFIIVGAVVLARFPTFAALLPHFFADAPLVMVTGVFTLFLGLTAFAAHHHWTSPPAIAVSAIGLLIILRGVLLLAAPEMIAGIAHAAVTAPIPVTLAAGLAALFGAWLTYAGWFAKSAA